ncbi:MAG: hypothetical protein JJT94_03960 [Bernardetiaceae bacterium]|nr:hypothetical protein [Bernardetiaceae bacterium]
MNGFFVIFGVVFCCLFLSLNDAKAQSSVSFKIDYQQIGADPTTGKYSRVLQKYEGSGNNVEAKVHCQNPGNKDCPTIGEIRQNLGLTTQSAPGQLIDGAGAAISAGQLIGSSQISDGTGTYKSSWHADSSDFIGSTEITVEQID